ncbi:FAD/NAD(P)-binding protein [Streptomyces microflavus]|uniref:FAD/NAD(P)-binding protein n=1 Tax=Streptomyces microflavus TaxID=1919 RepID=UPI003676312F
MAGHIEIAVVGAGPRGLSVLERICANERARPSHPGVTVHMVDRSAPGAGTVWRTGQSPHLLMNTVASQITVFTDESTRIAGPVVPGPTLYEWSTALASSAEPGGLPPEVVEEARGLGPDDYPSRAFYGCYLNDCFRRVVESAPEHVSVTLHRSRAVAIADTHGVPGGPQGLRLEDGTRLNRLDAIVLAQGHVPTRPTAREERTASLARIHHLDYVTPANPADLDLGGVPGGRPVLLRGLGLCFFDYMALFSAGRGGSFVREGGRLVYHPSGEEPLMYAFSRRGVPYHARGENEKGASGRYFPRLLTPEAIGRMRADRRDGSRVDFGRDLWPLIRREVESVYYGTLLTASGRDSDRRALVDTYLSAGEDELDALLDTAGIDPHDRWDWERIAKPCAGQEFADRDAFRGWLLAHLERDVREARSGNVRGPLKAALDVLRDLRNEIRLAVDHGGLDGNSHRDDLAGWYTPLNAYLSIGPPASRIEELIALIEAGIVEITGPGTDVRLDTAVPEFVATSGIVAGVPVRSAVLIEARLPEPDLRRTDDPLLRHLLNTDQAMPYRIRAAHGSWTETGGLAVSERPYHLLDGRGAAHPRRFAYGVPTESVHWVTAAGIRPGVDSVTVGDSDAIARAVLSLPPVAHVPAAVRPEIPQFGVDGVIV